MEARLDYLVDSFMCSNDETIGLREQKHVYFKDQLNHWYFHFALLLLLLLVWSFCSNAALMDACVKTDECMCQKVNLHYYNYLFLSITTRIPIS